MSYLHDTPLYSLLRSNIVLALAPDPAYEQRTKKKHEVKVLQDKCYIRDGTTEHKRSNHQWCNLLSD